MALRKKKDYLSKHPVTLLAATVLLTGIFSLGWYLGKYQERQIKVSSPSISTLNPSEDELEKNPQEVLAAQTGQTNNTLPGPGFHKQNVRVDSGVFSVALVGADMNTTSVVVDSASDTDCQNNCPVLPLKDYIVRSGAYAGINGSYFCPASYSNCSTKKNSFDTLLMNRNKTYLNSGNNVYSTVPAVIFQGNSVRFVKQSLEWGRDTSVDGVLANYPLLVFNNQINFTDSTEGKLLGRGSRSFIANKGSMIYIGVVFKASVAEVAKVVHALGMDNALNLDSGGSTALYSGGYKVGPGRNIPNAILFKTK